MPSREYDVIIVGAGSTGENVAGRIVKGGLSAVIVEADLVGGDCSYWACMPSKALLRPLQALAAAEAVDGARQAITGKIDVAAVFERRDSFTHHWNDDSQVKWLRDNGIDLVRGHGRLTGELRVAVTNAEGTTVELTARHAVVICTGSRAAIPPIPGLSDVRPWTSHEATSAHRAPRSLIILGGGVVGCEMATAWSQLGAEQVTMVEALPRLLGGIEAFAGEAVKTALEKHGVKVLTGKAARRAERDVNGSVRLYLDDEQAITAEELLVATGRAPRTDDLGLETVGLKPGSWLTVDDSMRVTATAGGSLYAAGDVNHRALLTHMGKYQGRVCGDVIAGRAKRDPNSANPRAWSAYAASADISAVPQVVFTDPEVAAVGMTEEQARERGISARAVDYDIGQIAGAAVYDDSYSGHARMIVDEKRNVLVGMTMVGPAIGELLHAATIAVVGAVPIDRLWHAVPSYPTISEVWLRLLETLGL